MQQIINATLQNGYIIDSKYSTTIFVDIVYYIVFHIIN
jgi:hypothetical protein